MKPHKIIGSKKMRKFTKTMTINFLALKLTVQVNDQNFSDNVISRNFFGYRALKVADFTQPGRAAVEKRTKQIHL